MISPPTPLLALMLGIFINRDAYSPVVGKRTYEESGDTLWVYVGTYTKSPEAGVNFCKLDLTSGSLSQPAVAARMVNPSFLAIHPTERVLYAIGEVAHTGKVKEGFVNAYAIRPGEDR